MRRPAPDRSETPSETPAGAPPPLAYAIRIVPDGFGGVFVLVPDVPDAFTFAGSYEEGLVRARSSLEQALEERLIRGEPLPPSREERGDHRLAVRLDGSGASRVTVVPPRPLHRSASARGIASRWRGKG